MKHVFALFSDGPAAEKAVQALSEAGLDPNKARIHNSQTIEGTSGTPGVPLPNAAPPISSAGAAPMGGAGLAGAGGPAGGVVLAEETIEGYLSKIGLDYDKIPFFKHGIKERGHIVAIDVENNDSDRAAQVLTDAGGKIPQAE